MLKKLVVVAGPDEGKTLLVPDDSPLLLGRSHAHTDTPLNDPHISRVHCEIQIHGDCVLLTDLNSAAGTCVNGRRITEQQLRSGDVIRIGNTQLRYQDNAAGKSAQEEPRQVERVEDLPGQLLSTYLVGAMLAKGQSGIVFRARDQKNNREVALKVLWPEFSRSEEEMQRFVRAMKTMLPLQHPNLAKLCGAGKTGAFCWAAMEFIEGDNLAAVIQRIGSGAVVDWRLGLRMAVHISLALDYAYGRQIIHRNIAPQNIMLRRCDQVAILGDLMLAKAIEGTLAAQITRPGELLGDVSYMSPERTRGTSDIDCRSDIYSLGATVYALLTGKPPFVGVSLPDTISRIRNVEPVKPKRFQPTMPDLLEATVLRMLAKQPEDRYQTPAEMLLPLEHIARVERVSL